MKVEQKKERLHAYMSGALTNISTVFTIPPFCEVDDGVLDKFNKFTRDNEIKNFGKDVEKEIKRHYVRVKDIVCKPLNVELYLPHEHSDPEHNADIAAETVHYVDRVRVTSSNFMLACADMPSFGVGQELEIAAQAGIPVIAYKHVRSKTSRMFLGNPILCDDAYNGLSPYSDSETIIEYEKEEDLFAKLSRRIEFLREFLGNSVRQRNRNDGTNSFSVRLRDFMEQNGYAETRKSAAALGVPGTFAAFLLKTPENLKAHFESDMPSMVPCFEELLRRGYNFDNFANPSLTMLQRLATVLNVNVAELLGESGEFNPRTLSVLNLFLKHHEDATVGEFYAVLRRTRNAAILQRGLRQSVEEILKELRNK